MEEPRRWATDTWRSLTASVFTPTGLPADGIDDRLDPASRPDYTSPTNIAGYLWSTVAACEIGLAEPAECRDRCHAVLHALDGMRRHRSSGMFYNWYAPSTGAVLSTWSARRVEIEPFVSSVDNGWLGAALLLVANAVPPVRDDALALLDSMDFGAFFDPDASIHGGMLRGGFWEDRPRVRSVKIELAGEPVWATAHHYDLLNSEPRIAVYVGMARGQLPASAYAALRSPQRTYRGRTVAASLGGSMFEALAPDMLVPEELWAPDTWGRNHADTVALQREFGLDDRGYGAWGFSPCACPGRRAQYREFGVRPIAWLRDGYRSEWRGQGVVTPHASVMALQYEPDAALDNLRQLEARGCYGPGGFVDAMGVRTGLHAHRHLTVDQSFIMAALANHVAGDVMRHRFCDGDLESVLRPLVSTRALHDATVVADPPRPTR